jgi:hypothetical protein
MSNNFTSIVHTGESKSLWNHTLSPGWTPEETRVLYLCLQKYGIGNYKKIMENMHLPEKTLAQINNQTQRFLGQQATREFHLMKVDLDAVNAWNAKKEGPEIHRKNGCIINAGNKLEKEEVLKLQDEHIKRFGLSAEYQRHIVIPTVTGEQTRQLMVEGEDLAEGWLSFRQQKMKRLASMELALERLTKQLESFGAREEGGRGHQGGAETAGGSGSNGSSGSGSGSSSGGGGGSKVDNDGPKRGADTPAPAATKKPALGNAKRKTSAAVPKPAAVAKKKDNGGDDDEDDEDDDDDDDDDNDDDDDDDDDDDADNSDKDSADSDDHDVDDDADKAAAAKRKKSSKTANGSKGKKASPAARSKTADAKPPPKKRPPAKPMQAKKTKASANAGDAAGEGAKRKRAPAPRKGKKTQEQLDAELAMRLQAEEEEEAGMWGY